jgi:hypothetical protein
MWNNAFRIATIIAILLLSMSAHAEASPVALSPAAATLAATPRHAAFPLPHAARPSGTTVLYDQTDEFASGVPTQDRQPADDAFDSFAADDFTVTDVNGWTVSGFNFTVAFQTDGELVDAPAGATYNITVYADANREIGTSICTYGGLPGTYDVSSTRLSVALPHGCVLPTGIYWLSMQVVADAPPQAFWMNAFFFDGVLESYGSVAKWKNPGGGFGVGCTDWTPLSECADADGNGVGAAIPNYLFQVVGFVNGNGGFNCSTAGICLQFTAAIADRNLPGLCGAATSLAVEAGDQVNLCYRVTNNTSIELPYQSLSDNVAGIAFTEIDHPLAPGETWQYNRTITVGASQTITAAWTAQDRLTNGYTYAVTGGVDRVFADGFDGTPPPSDGGFVDITSVGTPLALGDKYATANVTMPFSFDFYGRTSNLICVGNSGDIQFGITDCENFPNFGLPYLNMDAAVLAFWGQFANNGEVYTAVLGTAPTRRFVVEWFQKDDFLNPGDTATVTFETIFDEADGTIAFEYFDTVFGDPAVDNGADQTIGLQRNTSQADQFSYDEASVSSGSGIQWSRNVPTTFTGSATLTIASSAAHALVTPSSIALTAPAGGSASADLSIGNNGDRDLVWSLRPSASNAHLPVVSAFVVPMGGARAFSSGRAPTIKASGSPGHASHTPQPALGLPDVPSVAIESIRKELWRFSAEQPRDTTVVGDTGIPFGESLLTGGTYLDNDFSTLYALSFDNNGLYAVSTIDGHSDFIATASGLASSSISGMKQDPLSGIVYVSTLPPDASGTSLLWTIDTATAVTTLVGPISNSIAIIDIAFNSLGQLYGVDIATDALVAIDKATGAGSVVGSIGFNANYASGLAFDLETDALYFLTVEDFGGFNVFQEMWAIDTTTGAATLLSPVSTTPGEIQLDAFAIAHAPTACASVGEIPWLALDVTAGTTVPGQTSNVVLTAHTDGLATGLHEATLCVYSNDATQRRVSVTVSLNVTAAP